MYRQLATACLLVSLAACSSLEFPGVYRLPIDQGNIITQEMVDQLKIGMTRSQVEYVMGTPLVRDTFSPNRWDYIYTLNDPNNEKKEHHQLTVIFKDDLLSEFTTDIKPSAAATTDVETEITSDSE
ncbi:Outer membrane protein assembly factor BamE [Zhongshania aliphaticivorans]|uniref:Outer membrane protein assembly factor BamE n=1 Tax=Zhongshania aliphaticivorans TaxID=1470434 RepID=A0A5S9N7A2_9GAMM|nr:outer membrane protein assembly factor BamE [Zhongshania aliphaticivorans]CAA0081477.1 Outer membrane protein assembly factor BamE [Zhongshania aliphaticivorans]CAA0084984.1 Outer membrane protein assembly factor BamE [Zhongshania aliphaticivorans]